MGFPVENELQQSKLKRPFLAVKLLINFILKYFSIIFQLVQSILKKTESGFRFKVINIHIKTILTKVNIRPLQNDFVLSGRTRTRICFYNTDSDLFFTKSVREAFLCTLSFSARILGNFLFDSPSFINTYFNVRNSQF